MKERTAQSVIAQILQDAFEEGCGKPGQLSWDMDCFMATDDADLLAGRIVRSPFFKELWEA